MASIFSCALWPFGFLPLKKEEIYLFIGSLILGGLVS
jgi:hypothetical protein